MTNVGLTANNPDISRETVENHSQTKILHQELNYDFYWAANEISKILSKVKGVTYDDDDLEGMTLESVITLWKLMLYPVLFVNRLWYYTAGPILWKHVKIEYPTVKSFTYLQRQKPFHGKLLLKRSYAYPNLQLLELGVVQANFEKLRDSAIREIARS
ncbi:1520_t:CDS:2 [Funneliformis caledonium]|uniref:1520_t:CDS:1 n=1 Tax=Funneliformis caledonium TaxID=1117310 RepID=A0A9N9C9M5_9GLOM|nr:1520_t:CDS:2 [Funneliformis caledonium]